MKQQTIVTLDLEGVLVPEIWIAFAEKTGIDELRLTTRDIPDYDELMSGRLSILDRNSLKLADIQAVISMLTPLEGAKAFLDELRSMTQVVILSDTFQEFAKPLIEQLDWPTIFCHDLEINEEGSVVNYRLRQPDQKRKSVAAFRGLNYHVIAAGDSYNDTTMLAEADRGFLFRSPDNVKNEFPQFKSAEEYGELMQMIRGELAG
ncbi:MAG: bifunctional phosphoserine phosphatase/homoserine phosphotransferase ThrH [Verrucomicrobiota bacterium]|nr:bifunctional phosphoserine phosphatase/homoserine phosphotransferase ThrH [Verrucomicrobiota bacterium]